jgi:DNA-binding response OmpR family regulator
MAKILLVDDDKTLAGTLKDWLEAENHEVDMVHDGTSALEYLRGLAFDVVILDWNMPDIAGIDVCRRYRASGGQAAILMLTGMNQTRDKTSGLDAGADDYLTKPFEVEELVSRLKALLRRSRQFVGTTLTSGPISMDVGTHTVTCDGAEVQLKPIEFSLLEYFLRHPNEVLTPEALLKHVWPNDSDATVDAVYTCITRLRKKIKDEGRNGLIRNLHGVGYQFCPPKT